MPPGDLDGAVQLLEARGVEMLLRPGGAEGANQGLLVDIVLGKDGSRGEDVGVAHRATSMGRRTLTSSWPSSSSRSGTRKEFFTG